MQKGKSTYWSITALNIMNNIITAGIKNGKTKTEAIKEAAEFFNVTENAIWIKYSRYLKNQNMKHINLTDNKIPVVRKKAVKNLRKTVLIPQLTEKSFTFDIKDIKLDLKNKKVIVIC